MQTTFNRENIQPKQTFIKHKNTHFTKLKQTDFIENKPFSLSFEYQYHSQQGKMAVFCLFSSFVIFSVVSLSLWKYYVFALDNLFTQMMSALHSYNIWKKQSDFVGYIHN